MNGSGKDQEYMYLCVCSECTVHNKKKTTVEELLNPILDRFGYDQKCLEFDIFTLIWVYACAFV